jgi:hypothetical protein
MKKEKERERRREETTSQGQMNEPLRASVNRRRERESVESRPTPGGFDRETAVIGKEGVQ